MNKIILAIFLLLTLTSCFGDSKEIIDAKKELGIIEKTVEDIEKEKVQDNNSDLNNDPRISIKQVSGEKLLKLDKLNYNDFKDGYAKITGKTLGYVEKIKVDFSNESSELPNSSFILKKFKAGQDTFEYNARAKYKVLDFGLNKYIFTAYSGNGKSILELKVLVSVNDDKYLEGKIKNKKSSLFESQLKDNKTTEVTEMIGDENDIVFTKLPEGGDFGNVVKLGEKSFTYSDIKGLEIKKEMFQNISCGKNEDTDKYYVTEFLSERQNSYYYWNTCRSLIKDKGISFYVIRLDGDNYYYEKHYIDKVHGFYGIYELEKGEGVTKENISEKNKELKEENKEFENTKIVDNLFKKIINN